MEEHKILVVDDDSSIRRLLSYLLEKAGYTVVTADDGIEALARIESTKPDIVITDLMMGKLNGYELCRSIRARHEYDGIRIIVLTARDQTSDIEVLRESGVDCVMKKPINPQELTKTVRGFLGQQ
jgi:DNA-binding response OmpR family regulator